MTHSDSKLQIDANDGPYAVLNGLRAGSVGQKDAPSSDLNRCLLEGHQNAQSPTHDLQKAQVSVIYHPVVCIAKEQSKETSALIGQGCFVDLAIQPGLPGLEKVLP